MRDPVESALRSRPPEQAIRWVEAAAGPGARVTSVRRLRDGDSSAVHLLTIACGGRTERLVLRRFVRSDWLAVEPDLAAHEAAVLRLVETTSVPAPRLVAFDEDGSAAGLPAVLMSWLPGRVQLTPHRMDTWLRRMAELLPTIQAVHPSADELPYAYAPYTEPRDVQVPAWTSRPKAWQGIIEFARGPRPRPPECLIHRDYHPANILWSRGRITGIVDWVNACRGPAGVDIGHCRRNLALLHGVEVADRFLDHCLEWADYDPYWDIVTLTDWLPECRAYDGWGDLGLDVSTEAVHARADEYVASLVARL